MKAKACRLTISVLWKYLHLLNHYPCELPTRWQKIASGFNFDHVPDIGPCVTLGSTRSTKALPDLWKPPLSPAQCRWINDNLPDSLLNFSKTWSITSHFDCAASAAKDVILIPKLKECLLCKTPLQVVGRQESVSYPLIFTNGGTKVGISFHAVCSNTSCGTKFYYSFYKSGTKEKFYNDDCLEATNNYILFSQSTAFCLDFLHDLAIRNCLANESFEVMANIYNYRHFESNKTELVSGCISRTVHNTRLHTALNLSKEILEHAWLTRHCIEFLKNRNILSTFDFNIGKGSRMDRMHQILGEIKAMIISEKPPMLDHACDVPGCAEGYASVDGNEKVDRTICAAPKCKIQFSKNMAKVYNCCPNSPVFGNQYQPESRFCKDHQHLSDKSKKKTSKENNKSPNTPENILLTINWSAGTCSTRFDKDLASIPDSISPEGCESAPGCKKSSNIKKFHSTTAGVFCLVRPCGLVVSFSEMLSHESCSQLLRFLINLLDGSNAIRCIGYDRTCQFVPFLRRLRNASPPNPAAEYLLKLLDFMVDGFHVEKHTGTECILGDPLCEFHPLLEKFKKYNSPNTEAAEQFFSWLSRHKNSTKYMQQDVFFFYLYCNFNRRNNYLLTKKNRPTIPL